MISKMYGVNQKMPSLPTKELQDIFTSIVEEGKKNNDGGSAYES